MDNPDARRGHVLVIDDEASLCTVIRRTLGSEHEVVTVTSARRALELFDGGERYDIVLCDLMMPQMSGMELHAELMRLVPDQAQKMIFMTGGAFSEEAASFLTKVSNRTVEKPFKTTALRELVRNQMQ
jgi:CheY-like chemotaxis protein